VSSSRVPPCQHADRRRPADHREDQEPELPAGEREEHGSQTLCHLRQARTYVEADQIVVR